MLSVTPILKGHQLYHNFIRPREASKGKTPADFARVKVEGENKWLALIQHASKASQDGRPLSEVS